MGSTLSIESHQSRAFVSIVARAGVVKTSSASNVQMKGKVLASNAYVPKKYRRDAMPFQDGQSGFRDREKLKSKGVEANMIYGPKKEHRGFAKVVNEGNKMEINLKDKQVEKVKITTKVYSDLLGKVREA